MERARGTVGFRDEGGNTMPDAVAEKVIATLASVKRIPADKITLDTNLQEMGIDSLDVFTLLFELENAFKISIPDDDVRSIRTVNDIVEGIKKLLASAPPDSSSSAGSPAPAN
jgi:acyl carrier protein